VGAAFSREKKGIHQELSAKGQGRQRVNPHQFSDGIFISATDNRRLTTNNFYAAFETLTAQTLYSGIPEIGSRAALVNRLAAAAA
jgi:hypothetical protein